MAEIISHLEVVYGKDRAHESIPELNGGNQDINSGHKGEFVYLKKVVKTISPRPYGQHSQQQQEGTDTDDQLRRLQYIGIERLGNGDPTRADLAKASMMLGFGGPMVASVFRQRDGTG
ncbi:hypothetical protein TWF281_008841 [Arthrobotrys megalospora]